jgi:hypothetical protein
MNLLAYLTSTIFSTNRTGKGMNRKDATSTLELNGSLRVSPYSKAMRSISRRSLRCYFSAPAVKTVSMVLGLLLLTTLVSSPQIPSLTLQGTDSGIFAYTGQVILHGGVPYRDAWDNKPPGVYFTDALAFVFLGANLWALWLAQIISTMLTGLVLWRLLLARYRNERVALEGTVLFVFMAHHPVLTGTGNFTEIYALLPQVVCLYAGFQFLREPRPGWGLVMGMAAGMAFLTKQNTVAMALTFPVAVLLARPPFLRNPRKWIGGAAIIMVGGLSLLGLVAAYLARYGVLSDAIDAVFAAPAQFHNWVSRGAVLVWKTTLGTLVSPPVWLSMGPLIPLALIGGVLLTWEGLSHRAFDWRGLLRQTQRLRYGLSLVRARLALLMSSVRWVSPSFRATKNPVRGTLVLTPMTAAPEHTPPYFTTQVQATTLPNCPDAAASAFGLWVALTFVLDMALVNLTNRGGNLGYGHYYLTPVPAFVLLALTGLEQGVLSARLGPHVKRAVLMYSAAGTALWFPIVMAHLIVTSQGTLFGPQLLHPMVKYVVDHTAPTDRVLVWGAASKINFQSGRCSPTRFHYGYYLVIQGESTRGKIAELARDLETEQPVLIVDTAMDDGKHVPPLDLVQRREWEAMGGRHDVEDLTPVYDFVVRHCAKAARFDKFQVYRCTYSN